MNGDDGNMVIGAGLGGLTAALPPQRPAECVGDVELRVGHKLVGLEQDGSGVPARFENGAEERGAVLIGADGGNSTVRPLFDATPRRCSGYTTWLALSNVENFAPGTHTQW